MLLFFQSVFQLLTNDLGSLAYHLVLAFTLLAMILGGLSAQHANKTARRLVWGGGLLLLLRVGLFIAAGLAWQGFIPANLLPPLDRAAALISAVVIVWLWAADRPAKGVDTGAALVLLLAITGSVLGVVWWMEQAGGAPFNATQADRLFQLASLGILALGGLLLIIRRPAAWNTGLAMLALLIAGHAAHLLWPAGDGDYSGVVRFFELAAFPLMLALPGRKLSAASPITAGAGGEAGALESSQPAAAVQAAGSMPAKSLANASGWRDPETGEWLLELLALPAEETCPGLARLAARWMCAGWAAWIEPQPAGAGCRILCAAAAEGAGAVQSINETRTSLPALEALFLTGQALLQPATGQSPEQNFLANALHIPGAAPLLAVPVVTEQGSRYALAVLCPEGAPDWTPLDQDRLLRLCGPLGQYLQRSAQSQVSNTRLAGALKDLEDAHRQSAREQADIQRLFDELNQTQRDLAAERAQLQGLAALLAAPDAPRPAQSAQQVQSDHAAEEVAQVKGELRMALEEIARLNSEQPDPVAPPATQRDGERLVALIRDLRQPVTAVTGYSEFLLAESAGILSAMQRKFLERIRISTQRMARVLDDLDRAGARENALPPGELQEVDPGALLESIFAEVEPALAEKKVRLGRELPTAWPRLRLAKTDFETIVGAMLHSACQATRPGSQVTVRARIEHAEGKQDYLLVQVADQGGGLDQGELAQVFTPGGIGQAGNPYEPSRLKSLLDRQGGRIWMDNDPGRGLRCSVLLPVEAADTPGSSDKNGGEQA